MSPANSRGHVAAYRALLLLYPRSFRSGYRDPMVQVFRDRLRDVGARAWLRIVPDLLRSVPAQRIEAVMNRLSSAPRLLAVVVVVIAAGLMVIGRGGGIVLLVGVVGAVTLYTQRGLVAGLRRGDRVRLRHAATQSWWAPVAMLMALLLVLFGIGTVFEAHNWGGRIVGSTVLVLLGVTMLVGLVHRPYARAAGNAYILIATVPYVLMFWMIVPPILAIIVWVGVLSGGFEERTLAV